MIQRNNRSKECSVLDAKNQIDRIINYERCPNTNNWEDKIYRHEKLIILDSDIRAITRKRMIDVK